MSVYFTGPVWKYSTRKGSELLVLLSLADQANDDGICWPSMRSIAQRARLDSERQARRIVHQLVKDGEVEILTPGGGRGITPRYRIILPAIVGNPDAGDTLSLTETRTDSPDTRTDGAGKPGHLEGNPTGDEPEGAGEPSLKNRQEEPSREPSSAAKLSGAEQNAVRKQAQLVFEKISGLSYPKDRPGEAAKRWWDPLRRICALGRWNAAGVEHLIRLSYERLAERNLTISAPASLVNTALAIESEIQRGVVHRSGEPAGWQAIRAAMREEGLL